MKAKTREQYVKAWTDHVKELMWVAGDAGEWDQYLRIKSELVAIIEKAASANFPVQA